MIIAIGSLVAALAVYVAARPVPPAFLARFHASNTFTSLPGWFAGSAPAFFYTLALCLFVSAAAPARATRHCFAWTLLALGFELAQLPALAGPIEEWLATRLPLPLWQATAPYWTAGTFDRIDLFATCLAGLLALFLTRRSATGAAT